MENLKEKKSNLFQVTPLKYSPQLDGLRGIAILMVMCFHYFPNVPIFSFGWSGVDLFFVLSGFLISSRLLPYINNPRIVYIFYRNRALRIFPIYFTFIIIFFLCWFYFASVNTLNTQPFYSNYWGTFFIFLQNWAYIFSSTKTINELNHLWSLAVEEQFYLFFPLLVVGLKKAKNILYANFIIILLVLIYRCFQIYLYHTNCYDIYWNTFYRIDSLLIGSSFYILYNNNTVRKLILKISNWVLLLISFFLLQIFIYFNGIKINIPIILALGLTFISIFYGFLLFKIISKNNNVLFQLMSKTKLIYLGKISYGMYIFHFPIYFIGFTIINKFIFFLGIHLLSNSILFINAFSSFILTILISHFSYKNFESFILKWKIKL